MLGKILAMVFGGICCFDIVFIICALKISGKESRREEEEQ